MEAAVELGAAESGVRPACSSTEGACQRGRGWPSARHHNAPRAGIPAERFVLRLPSSSGDLHRVGGGQSEVSGSPWRVQAGHCPRALPSSPSPGHLHPRRHRFSQARHPGAMETLSPGQPERPCGLQTPGFLGPCPHYDRNLTYASWTPPDSLFQHTCCRASGRAPHGHSSRRVLRRALTGCPPQLPGWHPESDLRSLGFSSFCRPLPLPH